MSMDAVAVSLDAVSKSYGSVLAVRDISLLIEPGEIVTLLGPSGCGKTTTLRMIAGLERPDRGAIRIGSETVTDVPTWRRRIGMVFQNYALFPHLTVFQNVAFGLDVQGRPEGEVRERVAEAMKLVRLSGLEQRRPSQLSGGQRQRVAFARAIVTRPLVLLLDEPLAALDKKLREQMQVEIKELQRTLGVTTIFVTHDQEEALAISDRLVVMEGGRIDQVGSPAEIYEHPETRFVSDFIGLANALPVRVVQTHEAWATVQAQVGREVRVPNVRAIRPGESAEMVIRPEKVLVNPIDRQGLFIVSGKLVARVYAGPVTYLHVQIDDGTRIVAMASAEGNDEASHPTGTAIELAWKPEHVALFPTI